MTEQNANSISIAYYKITREIKEDDVLHQKICFSLYDNEKRVEGYFETDGTFAGAIWGNIPLLSYPAAVNVEPCNINASKVKLDFEVFLKAELEIRKARIATVKKNEKTGVIYYKVGPGLYVDDRGRRYLNHSEDGWLFGLPNYFSGAIENVDLKSFDLTKVFENGGNDANTTDEPILDAREEA